MICKTSKSHVTYYLIDQELKYLFVWIRSVSSIISTLKLQFITIFFIIFDLNWLFPKIERHSLQMNISLNKGVILMTSFDLFIVTKLILWKLCHWNGLNKNQKMILINSLLSFKCFISEKWYLYILVVRIRAYFDL